MSYWQHVLLRQEVQTHGFCFELLFESWVNELVYIFHFNVILITQMNYRIYIGEAVIDYRLLNHFTKLGFRQEITIMHLLLPSPL